MTDQQSDSERSLSEESETNVERYERLEGELKTLLAENRRMNGQPIMEFSRWHEELMEDCKGLMETGNNMWAYLKRFGSGLSLCDRRCVREQEYAKRKDHMPEAQARHEARMEADRRRNRYLMALEQLHGQQRIKRIAGT